MKRPISRVDPLGTQDHPATPSCRCLLSSWTPPICTIEPFLLRKQIPPPPTRNPLASMYLHVTCLSLLFRSSATEVVRPRPPSRLSGAPAHRRGVGRGAGGRRAAAGGADGGAAETGGNGVEQTRDGFLWG